MSTEEIEEIKRYFGVVAEGLRHDIQQIAEGHEIVLTQVKEFRKEVRAEFREVRAVIKFSRFFVMRSGIHQFTML